MAHLDPEQLESFTQDGYLLIRGALDSDEVDRLRSEGHAVIDRLARDHDVEATWSSADQVTHVATTLHHCHDVQFQSALFSRLLTDPRITDPASDILGTPNVQLHHNKLFIKPPLNGSPFPMHQDWPFFPHASDSTVAIVIHLDDAPEEKGCIKVMPGSHKRGRIQHLGERDWHLPTEAFPIESARAVPAQAGDLLFFGCLTVHGSAINRSGSSRTTWLLQVRDPSDVPTVDRHRSPGQGTMLRGINDGAAPPPSTL